MSRKINSKSTKSLSTVSGQTNSHPENLESTTPKSHRKSDADSKFSSFVFSPYSQEDDQNLDVIWDWSSSQMKTRPRKHKRLDFAQSPKLTIKRHPSHNQITDFIQLKEELETLNRDTCSNLSNSKPVKNTSLVELEDIFDDSMEDQLIRCSQEVEKRAISYLNSDLKVEEVFPKLNVPLTPPLTANMTDFRYNSTTIIKQTEVTSKLIEFDDTLETLGNDSFDHLLYNINDQDLNGLQSLSKALDKFETNDLHKVIESKSISIEEEIERKRKEALLKRESKKKKATTENESPIKCSPEEIEQKRLHALAKLQEKKEQEIIERNRLEAIKRLERNKQKRATRLNKTSISTN